MTILKGIPRIVPPDLLHAIARMGHGDMICFADANFPAASVASRTPGGLINCDGSDLPTLLRAVMKLLPLDETCPPASLMEMMPEHKAAGWKTPIWDEYRAIVNAAEGREVEFVEVERFAFYELAKTAFCVVSTGEQALYANVSAAGGRLETPSQALMPGPPTGTRRDAARPQEGRHWRRRVRAR